MPKAIDLSAVSPAEAAYLLERREQKRQEYQRRKDILNARAKAWRKANRDKVNAYNQQYRAELRDGAVKARFCERHGLQSKDVPQELVEMIRQSTLINRELKQRKVAP